MHDPADDLPRGPASITTDEDSAGSRYVQVDLGGGFRFRVTRTAGRPQFKQPEGKGLRFQLQDKDNRVLPGPEVGLEFVDEIIAAIAIAAAGHR